MIDFPDIPDAMFDFRGRMMPASRFATLQESTSGTNIAVRFDT
jgi:hypothetical protein